MHNFKEVVQNKNLITVFYECGSGGEFLVWLLGLHQSISARNFSVDSLNRWAINDNFCRMAGRGLEESLDNWQFPPNIEWYIARDHANLLHPIDKWQDSKNRSLEDGIKDFNNLYSLYWKNSKTIWLDIDCLEDLQFIDKLGAIKNYQQKHIHYSNSEYEDRFNEIKQRMLKKQSRFAGEFISINVSKLWLTDAENQFKKIINFLNIDESFLEIWIHMTAHWNNKNSLLTCDHKNCVPIGL
jgi:hypothetical protein